MITKEQAMTGREFHLEPCTKTIGPRGGVKIKQEVWRRNGKTQVWKTRPEEFCLPIKHGLRDYDQITHLKAYLVHTPEDCPLNQTPEFYTDDQRLQDYS